MRVLSVLAMVLVGTMSAFGQVPPPPPPPPPVPVLTDSITIDLAKSKIDKNSPGDFYLITIVADFNAAGPRMITGGVFNENTAQWGSVTNILGMPIVTTVQQATPGTTTFYYRIIKDSEWGASVADGTFDLAWVRVSMESVGGPGQINVSDSAWVKAK